MITFFLKDFLMYWRNRKEMIISLVTPILIIIVLGFALPDWVENTTSSITMKVAIVQLDDEAAALEKFQQSSSLQSLTEDELVTVQERMTDIEPAQWLKQALGNEGVESFLELQEMNYAEAANQVKKGNITAAIVLPEGFRLATMNKLLLQTGSGGLIEIMAEKATLQVDILSSIIDEFIASLHMRTAIEQQLGKQTEEALQKMNELALNGSIGTKEELGQVQRVTSFQYYALAISIVFALLMTSTIAAKAVTEKRERIFNRIVLSGSRSVHYLLGKFSSTFVLSLAQLASVLLVSHFILNIFPDRSLQFWAGVSSVFVMLALCVGGIAAFFTALIFRIKEDLANGIIFAVIMLAGTIGGGFVPIYVLPAWLRSAGEWTPNGLALSVLLKWLQTENIEDLIMMFILFVIFTIVALSAAIWIFPRKGHKV